jgi:hypothetical protein
MRSAAAQVLIELEPAPHQATELSGDAGAVGRIVASSSTGETHCMGVSCSIHVKFVQLVGLQTLGGLQQPAPRSVYVLCASVLFVYMLVTSSRAQLVEPNAHMQ